MRDIALLLLAIFAMTLLSIPVFIVRVVHKIISGGFDSYIYNLAKNIDYLGGALLDGTDGHTVSANSYALNKQYRIKFINWLFKNNNHCKDAYTYEYITKAKEGII